MKKICLTSAVLCNLCSGHIVFFFNCNKCVWRPCLLNSDLCLKILLYRFKITNSVLGPHQGLWIYWIPFYFSTVGIAFEHLQKIDEIGKIAFNRFNIPGILFLQFWLVSKEMEKGSITKVLMMLMNMQKISKMLFIIINL